MVRGGGGGQVCVSSSPIRLEQKVEEGWIHSPCLIWNIHLLRPSDAPGSQALGFRLEPLAPLVLSLQGWAELHHQLTDSRSWTPQPPLPCEPIPPNKSLYTYTHTHTTHTHTIHTHTTHTHTHTPHTHTHIYNWFCFSGKPWLIQKARNNQDLLEEGKFKYRGKDWRCMWLRFGGLESIGVMSPTEMGKLKYASNVLKEKWFGFRTEFGVMAGYTIL